MIKPNIFLLALLPLCLAINVSAQNMYGNVGVPSTGPGGSSGTDMVNVDLYTGTGSVSVPIYGYSIAGLNCGVSLSYNAKGIRVDQLASSVGLGWSLNAGGSITRQVKGMEDEVTMPAQYSGSDYLEGIIVPGANTTLYTDGSGNYQTTDDQEFDLYHLNLCGRSLTLQFYRDGNGDLQYITYPKSEIKVELFTKVLSSPPPVSPVNNTSYAMDYSSNDIQSGLSSGSNYRIGMDNANTLTFTITDEQGNKFYFERGDFQIKDYELTNSLLTTATTGTYYPTDEWDLVKVETYTGFTVEYKYVRKYVDYVETITEKLDPTFVFTYTGIAPNKTYGPDPLDVEEIHWKGYKTHLSQIIYPNNVTINFDLGSSFLNLSSRSAHRCDCHGNYIVKNIFIQAENDYVYDYSTRYALNYSYFNTPNSDIGISGSEKPYDIGCDDVTGSYTYPSYYTQQEKDDAKLLHEQRGLRLKLNSIDRYDLTETNTERLYTFEYNTENDLPYRFAGQKDYFGYYNGPNSCDPIVKDNLDHINDPNFDPNIPNQQLSSGEPEHIYYYSSLPFGVHNYDGSSINSSFGTNKTHDNEYMQSWILNKVKNGMGGEVAIEYSGNYTLSNHAKQYYYIEYQQPNSTPVEKYQFDANLEGQDVNDGLVVSTVTESNIYSTEHDRVIEYTYEEGQRFNRGGYSWYYGNDTSKKWYNNFWVSPNEYFNGSNHGFSKVTKTINGFNNQQLAKTAYYFSNMLYTVLGTTYSSFKRRTDDRHTTLPGELDKHFMGKIRKVQQYDELGNVVGEQEYNYITVDYTPSSGSYTSLTHFDGPSMLISECTQQYYDLAGIIHVRYAPITYKLSLLESKTSKTHTYDAGASNATRTISSTTTFEYDSNDNPYKITGTDSKGDTYRKEIWYVDRYKTWYPFYSTNPTPPVMTYVQAMYDDNLQFPLITESWKEHTSADDELVNFSCSSPQYTNGIVKFPASFASAQDELIAESDIFPFNSGAPQPSNKIERTSAVGYATNPTGITIFGTNLMLTTYTSKYDSRHNAIETWTNENKDVSSAIWDTRFAYKIAEVANAEYDDIAYTSFEASTSYEPMNTADDKKGNWDFDKAYINYHTVKADVMTGRYTYTLDPGNSSIVSKTLKNKEYIVTFWGNDDGIGNVPHLELFNGTTSSGALTVGSPKNTVDNWNLYVVKFTPNAGDHLEITFTNSGYSYKIDELRLHPSDAVMASYTYDLMLGKSSENNATNYITYYEYDDFGRRSIVRDMRGNVVQKIETRYDDLDN